MPQRRRQRDQRGAVENGVDRSEALGIKFEQVAAAQLDALDRAVFGSEGLHCFSGQVDAHDPMALGGEPDHVKALAGERHENAAAWCQRESRPVMRQRLVRRGLVEADLVALPALQPE